MAISDAQFKDIERRVKALEDYVAKKKVQQISLPLDTASQKIVIDVTS